MIFRGTQWKCYAGAFLLAGNEELLVLLGGEFGLPGKYSFPEKGWHGTEIT